jgi:hypothetical protein
MGFCKLFAQTGLKPPFSHLSLSIRKDYRHKPPALAVVFSYPSEYAV